MRTWKFPFSLLAKYKFNHNTDKKGVRSLATKEKYTKDQLMEFYRTMVRIRAFEEHAADCFTKGMLAGNIHLSIGQEAAEAGAFAASPQPHSSS